MKRFLLVLTLAIFGTGIHAQMLQRDAGDRGPDAIPNHSVTDSYGREVERWVGGKAVIIQYDELADPESLVGRMPIRMRYGEGPWVDLVGDPTVEAIMQKAIAAGPPPPNEKCMVVKPDTIGRAPKACMASDDPNADEEAVVIADNTAVMSVSPGYSANDPPTRQLQCQLNCSDITTRYMFACTAIGFLPPPGPVAAFVCGGIILSMGTYCSWSCTH